MSEFQQKLIAGATSGALVLTSNKRLARHLMAAFDRRMQAEGKRVWQTPQIISYEGWLHRCLAELGESWRLVEGFPALRLWEQLIEKDTAGSQLELLQIAATARKAQEAHQWSVIYGCQLDKIPLTEDQQVFRRWQREFVKQLRKQNWIDRAELPEVICRAISEQRITLPEEVVLVGFDQWSPELEKLQQTVSSAGGNVSEAQFESDSHAKMAVCPCSDPHDEELKAARWARALLEQGATSIGIVVPDLQARRKEIERVFRQQIDPGADLNFEDQESVFSLSLGSPLQQQGPIYAALALLSCGYRVGIESVSFLLRTPYLGGSLSEADKRALFDSRLRSFRQTEFSLKRLVELAFQEERAEQFGKLLKHLQQALEKPQKLLPGEWSGQFSQQLKNIGWPGERSLSSSEYQMVKAWQEKLLPALASLDPVAAPIGRSQAVGLLRRLAGEIEFQREAPTGPIQVIGLLESAGLAFDHLWVMGMNEEMFPAAARPNPFLPIAMQVDKGMPHASAAKELDFSRNVLRRLKAASPDIIFSYPQRSGDCDLRSSPLLAGLTEAAPSLAERNDLVARQSTEAIAKDVLNDSCGPALAAERGEGGTAIIKDQSLCPFRAFAHFRLRCNAFDTAQPGLDPMTRGNLVHKVLENFWDEVGSQQQLLGLEEECLQQLLETQVEKSLMEYFADQGKPVERLLEIERQRLQALVLEWLTNVDMQRPAFTVVEREQEYFEQIGPLTIRTFIDRVDQLDDGQRIILDYKTGLVRPDSLLAERLLEPQLPIYAIADDRSTADGVAFAQVRRGDCKLSGVAREDGLLPKVPGVASSKQAKELQLEDWPQLLGYWQQQLEGLAESFVAGEAAVDPVDIVTACRFCDLRPLCRIAEAEPNEISRGEGDE